MRCIFIIVGSFLCLGCICTGEDGTGTKANCEIEDFSVLCTPLMKNLCGSINVLRHECPHLCGLCEDAASETVEPVVTPELQTTVEPIESTECSDPDNCENSDLFLRGGVSDQDKTLILNVHNTLSRSGVFNIPLPEMRWDETMTDEAQLWAEQCKPYLDPNIAGEENGTVEQMRGMGSRSWFKTLEKWSTDSHLMEILEHGYNRVGCGYAVCSHHRQRFYFCNYRIAIEEATEAPACPKDKKLCLGYTSNECEVYRALPRLCPHLCGACED